MSDYVKRLEGLRKDLEKRDLIEIWDFTVQKPAPKAQIEAFEKQLDAELATPIREFYEEANGLKLHWRIQRDVSPEIADKLRAKSKDYYVEIAEYIGAPFAIVDILPLKQSVLKRKWKELEAMALEGEIEFNGRTYEADDFISRLKPFDILSAEYCMAFFLEEGSSDPPVLLLAEGWTDWENSRLTNFASYIEMLLATRGIAEARTKIFSEPDGSKKRPLVGDAEFWKKYTPDLFA